MKPSQIKKSIQSRYLHLEGMNRFTHFEPVFYFIFVAVMFPAFLFYDWVQNEEIGPLKSHLTALIIFTVVPMILSGVLYIHQIRRLRLRRVVTSRSISETREVVLDVANRNNWQVRNNRKDYMMLQTQPSFWSGSWGEQITLFLDGRDIWINSICDPSKRASIISMGRNKENQEILAHALSS